MVSGSRPGVFLGKDAMRIGLFVCVIGVVGGLSARAQAPSSDGGGVMEIRVPLNANGEANLAEVAQKLGDMSGTNIPGALPELWVPIRGVAGSLTRTLLSETLGKAVDIRIERDELVIQVDLDAVRAAGVVDWRARIRALAERVIREASIQQQYGMRRRASYRANDPARPTVVLIHGMNASSSVFIHMVPLLEQAGYGVLLYDYPDNRDLDATCPRFVEEWKAARAATRDTRPWAVLAHSMGAMLARWYVEGDEYSGDVSRLILLGPPNEGSPLAKAQSVFQWLQGVELAQGAQVGALSAYSEGLGEAAADLMPGSVFLRSLNARPRRAGVEYHILAGDVGFITKAQRVELETRLAGMRRLAGVFGKLATVAVSDLPAQLDALADGTGDGVVPISSTKLAGVHDHVVIGENHVALIRGPLLYPDPGPVACMPFVLNRLGRERVADER